MMKIFFVFLQLTWGYVLATPVGAYAYSDSAGNEYTGTYGDPYGQINRNGNGPYPSPFPITSFNDINGYDFPYYGGDPGFGINYFGNLQRFLQEAFARNIENQRLAFQAAQKAYDVSRNQAYNFPTFPNRFNPGFVAPTPFIPPNFEIADRMGTNSAFASSAVGPGFRQQIASIHPENPAIPNIYDRVGEANPENPNNRFYSVASSSYSTSSNLDGKLVNHRGSETMVNNNGKVTKYNVNI